MTLIVQITDPHLRDDGADPCHDPAAAMRAAFRQIAALDLRPEAILLTGDIIDRSAQGYGHSLRLLKQAPVPLLPMPGNHDRPAEFRAVFAGWADFAPDHLSFSIRIGGLVVVALDSTLPDGGPVWIRHDWTGWRGFWRWQRSLFFWPFTTPRFPPSCPTWNAQDFMARIGWPP